MVTFWFIAIIHLHFKVSVNKETYIRNNYIISLFIFNKKLLQRFNLHNKAKLFLNLLPSKENILKIGMKFVDKRLKIKI